MKAASSQPLKPQTEEDIQQIEWVKAAALGEKLSNTFPSVKDVIESVYGKKEKWGIIAGAIRSTDFITKLLFVAARVNRKFISLYRLPAGNNTRRG